MLCGPSVTLGGARTVEHDRCYGPAVRCRSALLASLAGLLATRAAHAEDPRDLFGLGGKPVEAPPSCDDGRAFGCATALDPFDDVSPYALRTWLTGSYLLRLPVGDARDDAV